MIEAMRKFLKDRFLSIQAKLVFPLAVTIILLVAVLSPLTNQLIQSRIEKDIDLRLGNVADSVGGMIANSETLARNNAALLANQPEVQQAFRDNKAGVEKLIVSKDTLGLQELSLYTASFKAGDQAYYYGGPPVTRRLQVNSDANHIRETLILLAIREQRPVSNVAIAPQNSQIIGAAPVFDSETNQLVGVVLTAFYMDEAYIRTISQIIKTDIAIVKDNAIIASTIDPAANYEALINQGWLLSAETPSTNVQYTNQVTYRLMGHPLVISGIRQGDVIVSQPVESLFGVSNDIQFVFFTVTSIFAVTALWFWVGAFLAFTRPLAHLTEATTALSKGDLSYQVNSNYFVFKDEITILSENFNTMAMNLKDLYASLEDKVNQRTHELAEARDEAVAANKSKTEFVSLVSHELKLPMTSIKGYSDLMLTGATGPLNESQTNFLSTIRNNVNRMATLVSDLADISRIESGHLRLEPRQVVVEDVVEDIISLTQTQVSQKQQVVTTNIPKDLPKAWCDRNRLAQVLTNLISNANKYTQPGGVIDIEVSLPDEMKGMLQVRVKDNGLGMTPEDQEKLFSKFFRSADDKVREAPGTGLGLNITKNLVEMQGGKIWFDSEYRRGTAFYFTVPVFDGQA